MTQEQKPTEDDVADALHPIARRGYGRVWAPGYELTNSLSWFARLPAIRAAACLSPGVLTQDLVRIVIDRIIAGLPDNRGLRRIAEVQFMLDSRVADMTYSERIAVLVEEAGLTTEILGERLATVRYLIARDLLQEALALGRPLNMGASEHGSHSGRRPVDTITAGIERALALVARRGLPVTPESASPELVWWCLGRDVTTLAPGDAGRSVAALNHFLEAQLDDFEITLWAPAARILFAHTTETKGLTLTERRTRAAETLRGNRKKTTRGSRQEATMDPTSFRKGVEPRIIAALAWQIYRTRPQGEDSN
jgi:hypothetical protein